MAWTFIADIVLLIGVILVAGLSPDSRHRRTTADASWAAARTTRHVTQKSRNIGTATESREAMGRL